MYSSPLQIWLCSERRPFVLKYGPHMSLPRLRTQPRILKNHAHPPITDAANVWIDRLLLECLSLAGVRCVHRRLGDLVAAVHQMKLRQRVASGSNFR